MRLELRDSEAYLAELRSDLADCSLRLRVRLRAIRPDRLAGWFLLCVFGFLRVLNVLLRLCFSFERRLLVCQVLEFSVQLGQFLLPLGQLRSLGLRAQGHEVIGV